MCQRELAIRPDEQRLRNTIASSEARMGVVADTCRRFIASALPKMLMVEEVLDE